MNSATNNAAIDSLRTAADITELSLVHGQMAVTRIADLLGFASVSSDPRMDTREGVYEIITDLMNRCELAAA